MRRIATDYLHTVAAVFKAFDPIEPLLAGALATTESRQIVDLCSGGTGPVIDLAEQVQARLGYAPRVVLTDLYPNRAAFASATERANVPVVAEAEPVDARAVPARLAGVRTLFNAFHHFKPADASQILKDAASARTPILIVEGTERSPAAIIGMLLFVPLLVLLLTPWVRPFSVARLLLTYVIPIAAPLILFDGIVSCLRSYTVEELRDMCRGLETDSYRFHIGVKQSRGQRLTYLVGCEGPLPEWAGV